MSITKDKSVNKVEDILCSECKNITHHIVLASIDISGFENWGEGDIFHWYVCDEILQCQGCSNTVFRKTTTNSEAWDPQRGPEYTTYIYPKVSKDILNIASSNLKCER